MGNSRLLNIKGIGPPCSTLGLQPKTMSGTRLCPKPWRGIEGRGEGEAGAGRREACWGTSFCNSRAKETSSKPESLLLGEDFDCIFSRFHAFLLRADCEIGVRCCAISNIVVTRVLCLIIIECEGELVRKICKSGRCARSGVVVIEVTP